MEKEIETPLADLLRPHATQLELPKGQTIHFSGSQDSSLYYIVEGLVRFVLNSCDGSEKLLYILGPETFFNEEALFGIREITAHVSCMEPCILWKIDSSVHSLLMQNTQFMRAVSGGMIKKISRLRQEVETISFMSCKQRILKIFSEEYNPDILYDHSWYDVRRKYTHQELAGIIGASRVTVSRLIAELCEENKIRCINRRIQINKNLTKNGE